MIELLLTRPVPGRRYELPASRRGSRETSPDPLRAMAHRFALPCVILAMLCYAAGALFHFTGQGWLSTLIALVPGLSFSIAALLAKLYPHAVRIYRNRRR